MRQKSRLSCHLFRILSVFTIFSRKETSQKNSSFFIIQYTAQVLFIYSYSLWSKNYFLYFMIGMCLCVVFNPSAKYCENASFLM